VNLCVGSFAPPILPANGVARPPKQRHEACNLKQRSKRAAKGLVLGLIAIALGGLALARSRRSRNSD